MTSILDHSDWYSKIVQNRWLMKNRNLYLPVLEAEVQDQGSSTVMKAFLLVYSLCPPIVLTWQENTRDFWGGPFYRNLNPIHQGSTLII